MTQQTLFKTADLDADAAAFDAANPRVMNLFIREALKLRLAGKEQWGAKQIYESLRWHPELSTEGEPFKLNNNHTSWYAREAMKREPRLAGFFRVREGKR